MKSPEFQSLGAQNCWFRYLLGFQSVEIEGMAAKQLSSTVLPLTSLLSKSKGRRRLVGFDTRTSRALKIICRNHTSEM